MRVFYGLRHTFRECRGRTCGERMRAMCCAVGVPSLSDGGVGRIVESKA